MTPTFDKVTTCFFPVALHCPSSLQKRGVITKTHNSQWGSGHKRNAHLRKHLIPEPLPWQSRHTSRRPSCNSELLYLSFPITHFNGGLTAVPLAEFSRHVLLSTQTVGEVTTYIRPYKPSSFFICQAFPLYLYKLMACI